MATYGFKELGKLFSEIQVSLPVLIVAVLLSGLSGALCAFAFFYVC